MNRATIRQLQVFEAVARHRSYTRAAEELFITQSTVSIQLKQLSESFGVDLVEQVGKKIYVTSVGEVLLENCRKVLVTMREIERDIETYSGKPQGQLEISGTITSQFFLPRIFGVFNKLYPEVNISLQVTKRPALMERFLTNQDDLYVLGRVPEDMDIKVIPFVENPLLVIASPDHPLAGEKRIPFSRIIQEPFLAREPGSTTLKEVEAFCSSQKLKINQRMVLGGNEAIKQGVMGGLGISILSRFTIALELKLGLITTLDVEDFPLQREWYIGYPVGKKVTPAARAFLDFVVEEGRAIAKSCLYP